MLALRLTYGWLNTVVPQIFGDGWESWFDNLSEYEISNLRVNGSGLEYYGRVIVGRLFKNRSIEFTGLCLVWNRLTTLLRRLEGEIKDMSGSKKSTHIGSINCFSIVRNGPCESDRQDKYNAMIARMRQRLEDKKVD